MINNREVLLYKDDLTSHQHDYTCREVQDLSTIIVKENKC